MLTANTSSLSFTDTGAQFAQTFTASEAGYTRTFTESNTCAPIAGVIASVSPASANGPSATFTVTAQSKGICSVTISDASAQTTTVNITVTTTSVIIQSQRTKHGS